MLVILLLVAFLPKQDGQVVRAQEDMRVRREIEAMAEAMSPAERVGQLFLVPFPGDSADPGSPLARLIADYHVGGILVDPMRGNLGAGEDAPAQLARLVAAAQVRNAEQAASPPPLLVAASRGGSTSGAAPVAGMSPLPSQLAIGATWDARQAELVGELLGRELALMGVNLQLGPGLDVNADPRPRSTGDLGLSSFGGSPAWVARLGGAYVAGLHSGSQGRVAAVVGSFPGVGSADRSQSQEVAVVERSLDQLRETDLPPFEALARAEDGSPQSIADGMRTTHVRYRNIQGQADRPFALDSNGLRYLDGQVEAIGQWRAAGGLRLSPGLGLPAVRRYVDPELQGFSPRRVIREALLAGHDLLLLEGFDQPATGVLTRTLEIEEGIAWLVGEYEADAEVRSRVDEALLRVLTLKHRLYGGFPTEPPLPEPERALAETGQDGQTVLGVAREALTLIGINEGGVLSSPEPGERLLLVVDARPSRACAECEPTLDLDPERMLGILRQAYGPEGSGTARLRDNADAQAITYRDLKLWLQDTGQIDPETLPVSLERLPEDRPAEEVAELVASARWMVFAMRDLRPTELPASDALRLFLAARPRAGAGDREAQRIVALAFDAPYHLDTTEIAGLHALFALYDRSPPFQEVAIRALFGDLPPAGASPVSVAGAGYDLASRLQPALDQTVGLEPVGWATGQEIRLGDTFRVRTSPILDRNGNLVPDGTQVTFRRYVRSGDVFLQDVPATTLRGRAMASIRAEREGEVEITVVQNGQAMGEPLVVRIRPGIGLEPPGPAITLFGRGMVPVDWGILMLSLSMILLAGVLVYGIDPETVRSPTLLVRMFLLSLAWGLAGYLLVAAGGIRLESLPAGARLWPAGWSPAYQAPVLSFACALVPVVPSILRALRARVR